MTDVLSRFFPEAPDDGEAGSGWPLWCDELAVTDEAFATAHDAASPGQRALIKQTLARMFAVHDPGRPTRRLEAAGYDPDVAALRLVRPRPYALVVLGPDFASPARLLAACLPALRARVPRLAVIRLEADTPWPWPLLAALELGGVESAFDMDSGRFAALTAELAAAAPGGVVVDCGPAVARPAGNEVVSMPAAGEIGVWRNAARTFDLEALAFAQAGSRVTVWGKTGGLPSGMAAEPGDFAEFLCRGYETAFVPATRIEAALARDDGPGLVLGPGMEAFWAWPHLSVTAFLGIRSGYAKRPQLAGSGI